MAQIKSRRVTSQTAAKTPPKAVGKSEATGEVKALIAMTSWSITRSIAEVKQHGLRFAEMIRDTATETDRGISSILLDGNGMTGGAAYALHVMSAEAKRRAAQYQDGQLKNKAREDVFRPLGLELQVGRGANADVSSRAPRSMVEVITGYAKIERADKRVRTIRTLLGRIAREWAKPLNLEVPKAGSGQAEAVGDEAGNVPGTSLQLALKIDNAWTKKSVTGENFVTGITRQKMVNGKPEVEVLVTPDELYNRIIGALTPEVAVEVGRRAASVLQRKVADSR